MTLTPAELERLRSGRPGCPSDIMLHRLHAGELTGEPLETMRRHVDGCEACKGRIAQVGAGFAAWPEFDPVRALAAIRREAERRHPWRTHPWRLLLAALAPLGAAAAVALLVLRPGGGEGPMLREKGGPALHVFRQKNGAAVEALSGERFRPGEPLQLTVDLAADGLVRIVGVEAGGALYSVWPRDGGEPFARMKAGRGQRIPGAITLDETPGAETFHVIACPQGSPPTACRSQGATAPPACPAGCLTSPFVLAKEK